MFTERNAWNLKKTMKMPETCPECDETATKTGGRLLVWDRTISAMGCLFSLSVFTLIAWWLLIGMSTQDHRFFWWMGFNAVFLILLQPWLMRLSRVVYLYIFVKYDPDYKRSG